MKRATRIALFALSFAGAAAVLWFRPWRSDPLLDVPSGLGPPAGRATGPSVVLVIGCSIRADQVPPAGGHPLVTPFLATFAEEAAWFGDVIGVSPWTRPSIAALVSGRTPRSLGLEQEGPGPNHRRIPEDATLLAERFRDLGYRTAGVSTNPNATASFGFAQGFERWSEGAIEAKVAGTDAVSRLFDLADALPGPRFLQIILADAHEPFAEEPEEVRLFRKLPAASSDMARYRVGLRHFDQALALLDRGLADRGTAGDTWLVVVSDHGEGLAFPPGIGRGHGRSLAPPILETLVAVWGPAVEPRRIGGLASSLDVAPTVLGLAGLSDDAGPGFDLSPLVRTGLGDAPRSTVFAETTWARVDRAALYTPTRYCQRDFGEEVGSEPASRFAPGCCERRADPACKRPQRDLELEALLSAQREAGRAAAGSPVEAAVSAELAARVEAYGYQERDRAGEGK